MERRIKLTDYEARVITIALMNFKGELNKGFIHGNFISNDPQQVSDLLEAHFINGTINQLTERFADRFPEILD